ncbi:hypothetical protein CTI12_AA252360 [Artemisia annua]|uniref:SKP1 component dimerisation domain-containing protein n=1 Tax=Artemisia annua TaxID=35608 RepID=A0A2U1NJA9_ARTAN|nr:hypothetical protein CTI12_AA252360 [Artemisia annua]
MSNTITVTEQATPIQTLTLKYPANDSPTDDASPSLDVVPDPNSNIEPETQTLVNEFLRKQALLKAAKEAKEAKAAAKEAKEAKASDEVNDEVNDNEIKSLENDLKSLVEGLDDPALKKLLNAAYYLKITELMDILCDMVAQKIKDMTVEEVREYFGIENDFTPEEEAEIRKENAWAYE